MTRLPQWIERLEWFLSENRERRFEYGSFDCGLFVCDCIQAMTGVDVAADFRGRYHSREEAVSLIRKTTGGRSIHKIVEYVTAVNQMPLIPAEYLQRGDVALIRRPSRDHSLAIVAMNGQELIVCNAKGLKSVPFAHAWLGWRV
jgi:hypothetical protein